MGWFTASSLSLCFLDTFLRGTFSLWWLEFLFPRCNRRVRHRDLSLDQMSMEHLRGRPISVISDISGENVKYLWEERDVTDTGGQLTILRRIVDSLAMDLMGEDQTLFPSLSLSVSLSSLSFSFTSVFHGKCILTWVERWEKSEGKIYPIKSGETSWCALLMEFVTQARFCLWFTVSYTFVEVIKKIFRIFALSKCYSPR